MMRYAWRWAEVGDKVLVHDREHLERDLLAGVVAVVKRDKQHHSIGIRVDDNGQNRWVWPTPLFVHPDPLDPDESCWICDENAARVTPPSAEPVLSSSR